MKQINELTKDELIEEVRELKKKMKKLRKEITESNNENIKLKRENIGLKTTIANLEIKLYKRYDSLHGEVSDTNNKRRI